MNRYTLNRGIPKLLIKVGNQPKVFCNIISRKQLCFPPGVFVGIKPNLRILGDEPSNQTFNHIALAWVLRRENVASALIGASHPQQVVENAKASGYTLEWDVLQQIDAALA